MTAICVICTRRETRTGMVCDPDRLRLARTLDEIVELYALLPAQLVPGQASGEKVSGSREAPLPLKVDPLDLTMPPRVPAPTDAARLYPRDQIGGPSVASALDSWVRDWRETLVQASNPGASVSELARFLRIWLEAACQDHPAIDEFADEMFKLARTLRVAVGIRSDKVRIGKCPVTDDKATCGATLTADPYLDAIRCPKCDTYWPRDKWIWLGMTLREEVA